MMLSLAVCLLLLLFVLPFAPGILEFRKPRDAAPLFVSMDYHKYPRYFASSFRKKFTDSLADAAALEGPREMQLSKKEMVQIAEQADFAPGEHAESLYYILRNLTSGRNVIFDKEVYVRGNARIGEDNRLQALASDGSVRIGSGTRISRWLDAEHDIIAGQSCGLGVDMTCGGMLVAARGCTFVRLFGAPVVAGEESCYRDDDGDEAGDHELLFRGEGIERNCTAIPVLSLKNSSIISIDTLAIGDFSVIRGHIKTHRDLIIGAHVIITGNIFADGSIEIGPHSRVYGTVFCQQHILVKNNARIGSKHRIKSVIGKKSVVLAQDVRVYGLVMTEGRGTIV